MTATQLVVMLLIGAAFGAGWLLRSDRADEPAEARPSALDEAWDAYARARETGRTGDLEALGAALRRAEDEAERLERDGGQDALLAAYDRALNALVGLRAELARAVSARAAR